MQANLLLLRYFVNFYINGGSPLTNDEMHNMTDSTVAFKPIFDLHVGLHKQSPRKVLQAYRIRHKKSNLYLYKLLFTSDSDRIQTCNLLIRSQVLYSVKLRSHPLIASAKISKNLFRTNIFQKKFSASLHISAFPLPLHPS